MANETRNLAQFVCDLQYSELPETVRERLRCFIIDNFAAGFLGSEQPWFRIVAEVAIELGGSGKAHSFNQKAALDPSRASLINGAAISAFEAEHTGAGGHPSATVFPAVLALGESLGSSGKAFLTALAAGYEVASRVGSAQTSLAERVRGFHNPAIGGVFGSAAGCAKLLGLSFEHTLSALGIVGSHSCGLVEFLWTGAMTKRLHLGRAAQMGLEAALLASKGFTGPPTILEGRYGYLQAYSPQPDVSVLGGDLGSKWLMEKINPKPFPAHGSSQVYIRVLDKWRHGGGDVSAIQGIQIKTEVEAAEARYTQKAPQTILGAQYSVPFVVALVLLEGTSGLLGLNENTLRDERVLRLAERITLEQDERFEGNITSAGAEIVIDLGDDHETLSAPGLDPFQLDELHTICRDHLFSYGERVISADQIAQIETTINQIEQLSDVSNLGQFMEF